MKVTLYTFHFKIARSLKIAVIWFAFSYHLLKINVSKLSNCLIQTTHMMTRFPLRYSHNIGKCRVFLCVQYYQTLLHPIDLDRKRLMYLSCCMEKDLELENQYLER